ncbi:MAG: hypothetical protein AABY18_00440 [Candidatus Thermoplasmatota archaeon]
MTPNRHPKDPAMRDRELEAWLEHAMGTRHPDPEPVVRDLDE